MILARREELVNKIKQKDNSHLKPALIDILLQSTLNGQSLSNLDIREEVDTFMFAGHDTTTSSISFCLYNLAKYPDIQLNTFNEIRNVFGDDLKTEVSFESLNDLQYLDLVIKETLRLFPSVPFFGRKLHEEVLISEK